MEVYNCDSCFSEQRSLNDIFQQAISDAKKLANEQNKKVAVIQEGQGYQLRFITNQIPGATRYVAEPGQ
mgnify:CR=1 FL=1